MKNISAVAAVKPCSQAGGILVKTAEETEAAAAAAGQVKVLLVLAARQAAVEVAAVTIVAGSGVLPVVNPHKEGRPHMPGIQASEQCTYTQHTAHALNQHSL